LRAIVALKPAYRWGGAISERAGLDCSGYLFLAAKRAGLPVKRTTSARMAVGEGGWVGRCIPREEADAADLCFWTFDERRPHGHVGAFLGKGGPATHASSRRGVVVEPLIGALDRAFSMARRLTLGDR
jgi:cell wall-associated NlpC family hydrolase